MIDWSKLSHAYGSAEDLPEILAGLEPDYRNCPAWGDLIGRVCHQGTTYSASPYVLPYLSELAASWTGEARVMPLFLASSMVESREFKLDGFEQEVEDLHFLAEEMLRSEEIDAMHRVYVVSAALTLGGDKLWGRAIEGLNDQEFHGTCPPCGSTVRFTIGTVGSYTSLNYDRVGTHPITPVVRLADMGQWLYDIFNDSNNRQQAEQILYLFGTTTCPQCRQKIQVSEAVEKFERN